MRMLGPINQLFKDESIAVQIRFLDVYNNNNNNVYRDASSVDYTQNGLSM